MPRKSQAKKTDWDHSRKAEKIELKPLVSAEDLKADTEHDPEGAEEFVALVRELRKSDLRSLRV